MTQHNVASVLEHHLKQNVGQKITPHLIYGLVHLVHANCDQLDLLKKEEIPAEPNKDTND